MDCGLKRGPKISFLQLCVGGKVQEDCTGKEIGKEEFRVLGMDIEISHETQNILRVALILVRCFHSKPGMLPSGRIMLNQSRPALFNINVNILLVVAQL